jgi:hypothetical protein
MNSYSMFIAPPACCNYALVRQRKTMQALIIITREKVAELPSIIGLLSVLSKITNDYCMNMKLKLARLDVDNHSDCSRCHYVTLQGRRYSFKIILNVKKLFSLKSLVMGNRH